MSDHPIIAAIRPKLADPARPFVLIADFRAQPGRGDEIALAILNSQAVELSRREEGCIAYELCRDADDPSCFTAVECWRDLASLALHLTTPHFAAVGDALNRLIADAPTIRILVPIADNR
jgi:quinol monooxygenase YgiN